MAFVYKSEAVAAPRSPLARASYDRQRDVYVLASRYKNADCRRLWGDFAAEQPAMARLVVKDVEAERSDTLAVNEKIDKRLRQAERMVVKAQKPKAGKAAKAKVNKAHQVLYDDPAAHRAWVAKHRGADSIVSMWLDSCDPAKRELARTMLASRG